MTISEVKNAVKIMVSKEFWKDFFAFYSTENIAKWLDKKAKELDELNKKL